MGTNEALEPTKSRRMPLEFNRHQRGSSPRPGGGEEITRMEKAKGELMPEKKLKDFLSRGKVKHISIYHSPTYTAQEIAALTHIPGKELAKTVIVKLDGKMAMAVLPASYQVDFDLLKQASGAGNVELASEEEFQDCFPGCEVGAMPPFGNLYGMEVYAAKSLAEDETIAFNAGTHFELIRMAYKDFERLVQPRVVKFSRGLTSRPRF
jgi:Ala-tRNA(Pro) deacylase